MVIRNQNHNSRSDFPKRKIYCYLVNRFLIQVLYVYTKVRQNYFSKTKIHEDFVNETLFQLNFPIYS